MALPPQGIQCKSLAKTYRVTPYQRDKCDQPYIFCTKSNNTKFPVLSIEYLGPHPHNL